MGWLTTGRLAAAVSAAGGLGVIATGGYMGATELSEHIAHVHDEAPGRPFGVNILLPSGAPDEGVFASRERVREQLDLCFTEKVPVIVTGLGDPSAILSEAHAAGSRVVAVVGGARSARKVASVGVDAVIIQGNEAGGHVGPTGTLTLAQSVIRDTDVPVLLAGGIATNDAVQAALALGAAGVSVGTRFIASEESDAHEAYKRAVVAAGESETVVTRACTGKPSRALRTPFVESWIGREREIEPYPERARSHFWRARAGCLEGDLVEGFLPLGQCAAVVDSILPADAIVDRLTEGLS
jgi:enoyl-[acyl-carrier protein] reductase II